MEYNFEIVFKREYAVPGLHLHTLRFRSEIEIIESLVEHYGKAGTVVFLKEFLSKWPKDQAIQETSDLTEDQLKEEVQRLLSENSHLETAKKILEDEFSKLSKSRTNTQSWNLSVENQRLSSDLTRERERSNQYSQDAVQYKNLRERWSQLFPQFSKLEELANHVNLLNDKLQKSKQDSDRRLQKTEQELRDTEQKLSLATSRLRGVNTHSELGGGGSRSDQLKNEFSHLKMGLFHDASSKILNGWRDQGSSLTFRSEEFSKIKSILSQRVFGDGMAYFAKDKTAVDAELYLVMDALEGIKGFSPTVAVFQEIQEKVQVGLLRVKGVDHSDETLVKYIEETTQRIDQDLESIANFKTTDEALCEIREFVKAGLKIVRDIVNDAKSGEMFIPETGIPFDEYAHDTRDDDQGQIKMTICAGYRIKETVLVKADVITYEPEVTLSGNEPEPLKSQIPNHQNSQPEGETQANSNSNVQKVEEMRDTSNLPVGQFDSIFLEISSSTPFQGHVEGSHVNPGSSDSNDTEKSSTTFKGRVTCKLKFRYSPKKEDKAKSEAASGEVLNFEAWLIGEPWNEDDSSNDLQNKKWYKLAGQDYWLPAVHIEIEGVLPTELEIKEATGDRDEVQ